MVRLVLGAPAFAIGFLTGLFVAASRPPASSVARPTGGAGKAPAGKPARRRDASPTYVPVLIVPSLEDIGLCATAPAPLRAPRPSPGA